jgi:hypothetical protein
MCAVLSVQENRRVFMDYLIETNNTDSFLFVDECSKLIASFPTLSDEGKRQAFQLFMDTFFAPYKAVSFSAAAAPASKNVDINLRFEIKSPLELEWQQIRRGVRQDYSVLLGYLDHAMDSVLGPIADAGGPFPQARQVRPALRTIPTSNPDRSPIRPWPVYYLSSPDLRPPLAEQQTAALMRAQVNLLASDLEPDQHLSDMINLQNKPFGEILQMFLDAANKRNAKECWAILREIVSERRKGDRGEAVGRADAATRNEAIAAAITLVNLSADSGGNEGPEILNPRVIDAVTLLLE